MILLLLFSLVPTLIAGFASYTPETYPDSVNQPELCHQLRPSFLCDPNDLIKVSNNTEKVDKIINSLLEVRGKTQCSCSAADSSQCTISQNGFTMSIAIVPKLKLNDNENTRANLLRAAELFADRVRDRQHRGQCDDDILVIYSSNDSIIWTSVGEVTGRYLHRTVIDKVEKQAESYFDKGKYIDGLQLMIDQYTHALKGEQLERVWMWPLPLWASILIAVIIALLVIALTVFICAKYCIRRRVEYNVVERNDPDKYEHSERTRATTTIGCCCCN